MFGFEMNTAAEGRGARVTAYGPAAPAKTFAGIVKCQLACGKAIETVANYLLKARSLIP